MADGNPDAKGKPKPPPNLRVSDDETRECDVCAHYRRGKCLMYECEPGEPLPVNDEWVCDSFEKAAGRKDPDDDEDETPASEQPKNLRDAEREGRNAIRRGRGEKVRG